MSAQPRICVVVPVYNHGLTVQRVARGAKAMLPVIVVDDGSTDGTPEVLAAEAGLVLVTFPENRGKAAALKAGFARAEELGFTHAITIDADGQHSTAALPQFADACRRQPAAFIIGVRDFKKSGAPLARRASNSLSNFWFKFETGVFLEDTQCGYRCYPLQELRPLSVSSARYAYELEIMVKAAWAGVPLLAIPVDADYHQPTSRMSHFRPGRDTAGISWLHLRLSAQALLLPAALRKLLTRGALKGMPLGQRFRTVLRHLFSRAT
jgi:glycosyltransferase involved in cell wall biosynthesis